MYTHTAPVQGASSFVPQSFISTQENIEPLRLVFDFLLGVKSFSTVAYSISDRKIISFLPIHILDVIDHLPAIRSYVDLFGGHTYFNCLLWHIDAYQMEALIEQLDHGWVNASHAVDVLNDFINALKQDLNAYQAGYSIQKYCYNQDQMDSMQDLIDAAFKRYSKLLVLRIDLRYQDDVPVSYEQAKSDIQRFMDSRRFNTLFDDVVGFAYKLERGVNFHFHTLWLVNGHKHHKDAYFAQCIADRWSRMTEGQGVAYICNYDKQRYQHCGIGMVHRANTVKRDHLLQAASYLCKKDLLTKAYIPHHHRVFFRSVVKS